MCWKPSRARIRAPRACFRARSVAAGTPRKWLADLYGLARQRLAGAGVPGGVRRCRLHLQRARPLLLSPPRPAHGPPGCADLARRLIRQPSTDRAHEHTRLDRHLLPGRRGTQRGGSRRGGLARRPFARAHADQLCGWRAARGGLPGDPAARVRERGLAPLARRHHPRRHPRLLPAREAGPVAAPPRAAVGRGATQSTRAWTRSQSRSRAQRHDDHDRRHRAQLRRRCPDRRRVHGRRQARHRHGAGHHRPRDPLGGRGFRHPPAFRLQPAQGLHREPGVEPGDAGGRVCSATRRCRPCRAGSRRCWDSSPQA